jgi:predicted transcriptional regulator
MKNRSDAISVRVSSEAKAELQRIADAERRTLSQLVAIIIDDYLKGRTTKTVSGALFTG